MFLFYCILTKTNRLLFTMYLYWLYLKHLCYKPSSYACKWSFLVQAGTGLWAKCTREPRAYSTSAVLPLPFVNMDPSKLSTMYTCILLAAEQRKKCGWYCTAIKFDFPLEKTREMVLVEGKLTLLSGVNIDSARRISLCLHSDRHNYGTGAHVFLKTTSGVTRWHGISLSNQAEPAQPIWVRIASSRISRE